jgi:ATP-dependent exoDNAse (exonuclease V) beta subunit
MEFGDVLLWNFFTDSPCPGGWRCLDALKINSGDFDSKKYAAMCSELKQFYVAVTRARIRLSIIKSQDELAARSSRYTYPHKTLHRH